MNQEEINDTQSSGVKPETLDTTITNLPNNSEVTPIPPVTPINLQPEGIVTEVPNNTPVTPKEVEPLMGTSLTNMNVSNMGGTPDGEQVNSGSMTGIPNPSFNIPTPPAMTNPTVETPISELAPKKKKENKLALILLIIVLIAGIGGGVYYFLSLSKQKATTNAITITPLVSSLELGSTTPTLVTQLVTLSGTTSGNCSLTSNTIDTSKTGTYEYTVTCGAKTYTGKIAVTDTKAPEVYLADVTVVPNTNVKIDDFIYKVIDASSYTVKLEDESKKIDTSKEGTFTYDLVISDEYDNKANVTANLVVDAKGPSSYLYCDATNIKNDINATYTTTYRFGIREDNTRYNAYKIDQFVFKTLEDYKTAVNSYTSNNTLEKVTGTAIKDEKNLTIYFYNKIEDKDLATNFNLTTFSSDSTEIQSLFNNQCSIGVK